MNVTETREVFAAITALITRYKDAMKDGKLSLLEKAAFLTEYKTVEKALDRIADVPAELLDLTEDETPDITADVQNVLASWGLPARSQDVTKLIVSRMPTLIDLSQALIGELRELCREIDELPPSALPVNPSET